MALRRSNAQFFGDQIAQEIHAKTPKKLVELTQMTEGEPGNLYEQKAANQGAVPFYGCPKCRWSRGGCIWWKCNPEKFKAHKAKFPEKYVDKKELAALIEQKIKVSELKQGEFEQL